MKPFKEHLLVSAANKLTQTVVPVEVKNPQFDRHHRLPENVFGSIDNASQPSGVLAMTPRLVEAGTLRGPRLAVKYGCLRRICRLPSWCGQTMWHSVPTDSVSPC